MRSMGRRKAGFGLKEKKEQLVIDGNDVYEIDLECLKKKKQREIRSGGQKQTGTKKKQGT